MSARVAHLILPAMLLTACACDSPNQHASARATVSGVSPTEPSDASAVPAAAWQDASAPVPAPELAPKAGFASCRGCGLLGSACPEQRRVPGKTVRIGGAARHIICDDSAGSVGPIVGLFGPINYGFTAPDGEVLYSQPARSWIEGNSPIKQVRWSAQGPLNIDVVTCGRCRRVGGWSFIGDPARLPPDLLSDLQQLLGLKRKPLLWSREQWSAALASLP